MDLLAAFRVFVRVAEAGSFSGVAREMGVTQPAVSRMVSALEEHLGARLLHRTTRSLALTSDGQEMLVHARGVLDAVERAETAMRGQHDAPAGLVRVSSSVTFGRVVIAPRLPALLAQHPKLEIDLRLADGFVDLVHDGVDVAVRVGPINEATLIARRIGVVRRQIVAATDYLARHGTPRQIADLASHECILMDRTAHPDLWTLDGPHGSEEVHVHGRFRTDSVEAAKVATVNGMGLALLSSWLMKAELADGRVVAVLPEWHPPVSPVHAVYPSSRNLAPRTRAVIDFLVQEFRADPNLSGAD